MRRTSSSGLPTDYYIPLLIHLLHSPSHPTSSTFNPSTKTLRYSPRPLQSPRLQNHLGLHKHLAPHSRLAPHLAQYPIFTPTPLLLHPHIQLLNPPSFNSQPACTMLATILCLTSARINRERTVAYLVLCVPLWWFISCVGCAFEIGIVLFGRSLDYTSTTDETIVCGNV